MNPVDRSKRGLAGIARYKWIDRLRALSREPKASLDDDTQDQPSVDDHGSAVVTAVPAS